MPDASAATVAMVITVATVVLRVGTADVRAMVEWLREVVPGCSVTVATAGELVDLVTVAQAARAHRVAQAVTAAMVVASLATEALAVQVVPVA
jgi:hypothetical protein